MSVHEAMAKVGAAVSAIAKQSSSGVSYKFRGIDDVMNALHKPLADNGLFLAPRVLDDWQVNMIPGTNNRTQSQALFRVAVDVYHKDGTMVTLGPGLAQSHDYGDKAVYQASQNCIKYLLLNAFSVPTGDVDMDAVQPDPVPVEPDPADWLKDQVESFTNWSKEQSREAYKTAMAALAFDTPLSQEQADQVFRHMANTYEQEAPFDE
jgi:hypothetical protein